MPAIITLLTFLPYQLYGVTSCSSFSNFWNNVPKPFYSEALLNVALPLVRL